MPLIDCSEGFESAVEIKCLVAVRFGLSSQTCTTANGRADLSWVAGVNCVVAGCEGQRRGGAGQLPWPGLEISSLTPLKK